MTDRAAGVETLVFLHFLGGSGASWARVIGYLPGSWRCVTIDFAGFGEAADRDGADVAAMADHVAMVVRREVGGEWTLIGHSMGAKVAAVVARRAEDGEAGLAGLRRIMLVAGSPPGPEPMDEAQRQVMLGWFGGAGSGEEADGYIRDNVTVPLGEVAHGAAVADVLRANRGAWMAWLDGGSREDWAERVGVLRLPALIVAGETDGDLGEAAQRSLMARHFADHRVVVLAETGHLIPMERPEVLARLIEAHVAGRGGVDAAYWALIGSDRVSAGTRRALLGRLGGDGSVPDDVAATLRAVLDRVIPQEGVVRIDLAGPVWRSVREGNGWRFAALPADEAAWREGLAALDAAGLVRAGVAFAALDGAVQDEVLAAIAAGDGGAGLTLWFEEVRSEAVRAYMAHPATLARIGYSGIGYGGDGPGKAGFGRVGLDEREAWEPVRGDGG